MRYSGIMICRIFLLFNKQTPIGLPSFAVPEDPSLLTYGLYAPTLVVLSLLVAIFSSWMGLQVTGQASAHPSQRAIVLGAGSGAAARFSGTVGPGTAADTNSGFLALSLTVTTVALSVAVLGVNGLLRYRQMFQDLSRSEAWMRALLTTTVDGVIK